jgi:hypothetical protein
VSLSSSLPSCGSLRSHRVTSPQTQWSGMSGCRWPVLVTGLGETRLVSRRHLLRKPWFSR